MIKGMVTHLQHAEEKRRAHDAEFEARDEDMAVGRGHDSGRGHYSMMGRNSWENGASSHREIGAA